MEKNYLIYVNLIGKDYRSNYIYEFIFSDTIKDIEGELWNSYPASGRPEPPYENHIKLVGRLECDLKFDVIQNSDSFCVWDAVDGVIAMAWENINSCEEWPKNRLLFKFGDEKTIVEEKLYSRDLILNYDENKD